MNIMGIFQSRVIRWLYNLNPGMKILAIAVGSLMILIGPSILPMDLLSSIPLSRMKRTLLGILFIILGLVVDISLISSYYFALYKTEKDINNTSDRVEEAKYGLDTQFYSLMDQKLVGPVSSPREKEGITFDNRLFCVERQIGIVKDEEYPHLPDTQTSEPLIDRVENLEERVAELD